jgi:hypothetical protein
MGTELVCIVSSRSYMGTSLIWKGTQLLKDALSTEMLSCFKWEIILAICLVNRKLLELTARRDLRTTFTVDSSARVQMVQRRKCTHAYQLWRVGQNMAFEFLPLLMAAVTSDVSEASDPYVGGTYGVFLAGSWCSHGEFPTRCCAAGWRVSTRVLSVLYTNQGNHGNQANHSSQVTCWFPTQSLRHAEERKRFQVFM